MMNEKCAACIHCEVCGFIESDVARDGACDFYEDGKEWELTKEEKALLQKWHDNRGISMKDFEDAMDALEQEPCEDWYDVPSNEMTLEQARQAVRDLREMWAEHLWQEPKWIPVSERLPELNRPLLVTAYHRVCYAHMISKSGNYGYPVFRLHEIKDSDRGWVQETISEPYSKGRIDAWMYIDIPEPYKAESEDKE